MVCSSLTLITSTLINISQLFPNQTDDEITEEKAVGDAANQDEVDLSAAVMELTQASRYVGAANLCAV